ncbi:ABC transporter substrate-binding protein [Plantibacter sp. Mn2098]|uniref:ABC transporter substrate-binding protein n=1 Tax=Plantibacter sp. Mn2098 TaxID=3395266 RepID=UPI003BE3340A
MKNAATLNRSASRLARRASPRVIGTAMVGVAGLALGLVGCAADAGGPVTLTYWATNQGTTIEEDQRILGESIERFTEQTGIEVELEVIPWADLYSKILAAVSSGEGPHVLNIGNTWAVTLQETGAFVPFEGDVLESIGGSERFIPSSWAAAGKPGQAPTSVPLYAMSYGLYYNPKLLAAAGIDGPPSTWQEFVADAKRLTVDTDGDGAIDQWGTTLIGGAVTSGAHFAFILGQQYGADWFAADGTPQLDSPGMVEAVGTYVDLLGTDGVASPADAESELSADSVQDFIDGKAATIIVQSPRAQFELAGFTDWALAEVPVIDPLPAGGRPIGTHVAGTNVSVFQDSTHQDESFKFIDFLTSPAEQQTLTGAYMVLPVTTEAYADGSLEAADPSIGVSQDILADHAEPFPLDSRTGQAETLIGTAVKSLLAKAATGGTVGPAEVKAALADAQSQLSAAG